jgi:hypothetical protein
MQLPNSSELPDVCATLNARLDERAEWFCAQERQRPVSLRRDELEFRVERGRLYFACWGRDGAQLWRVTEFEEDGAKILLNVERRAGAVRATLELVPRASVREGKIELATARLDLCARLAHLARDAGENLSIERLALSEGATRTEPGPFARVVLREGARRIYATGPVVPLEPGRVETFLASALLWWHKARDAAEFWLLIEEAACDSVGERLALLRDEWRANVKLWSRDAAWERLTARRAPTLDELWQREVKPLPKPSAAHSVWAEGVAAQYPDAVDAVYGRQGATLRWRGLPFARVRRVLREERVWFGVDEQRRRILSHETQAAWDQLIAELHAHRRPDAPDRRHEFYRARAEAWLETLLRRDITQLDPGLIAAPLHAQFRTASASSRPVDLLALRQDGRLAVIELKAREDREHPLQGADYWLRVEQQRRRGHLQAARLFGKKEIADEPALVYLAAPLMSFHRDFGTLARMLRPDIETFRFDLNEDWRAGVRVARRLRQ